jgi:4-aminobutyrate aminotransferase-like enzyme
MSLYLLGPIEFVEAERPMTAKIRDQCFENSLAVYLASGEVEAIIFAPPFIITEQEVEELVRIFVASTVEAIR